MYFNVGRPHHEKKKYRIMTGGILFQDSPTFFPEKMKSLKQKQKCH